MSSLRQKYLDTWFVADLSTDECPTMFGIVTAYNPDGKAVSDAVNRQADMKLKRRLERSELFHFRVTGVSRDGTHREPGFAIVNSDPAVIDELSREFQ
jgi:hypothetical protein